MRPAPRDEVHGIERKFKDKAPRRGRPPKVALLKRAREPEEMKAGDLTKAIKTQTQQVTIRPPEFRILPLTIRGKTPYVQHKFAQKAINTMMETQMAGSQAKKGKKRDPKNFDHVYQNAMHVAKQG